MLQINIYVIKIACPFRSLSLVKDALSDRPQTEFLMQIWVFKFQGYERPLYHVRKKKNSTMCSLKWFALEAAETLNVWLMRSKFKNVLSKRKMMVDTEQKSHQYNGYSINMHFLRYIMNHFSFPFIYPQLPSAKNTQNRLCELHCKKANY